jgi:hypothetical protein
MSLISTVLKRKCHEIFEGKLLGPVYCEYSKEQKLLFPSRSFIFGVWKGSDKIT